MQKENKLLSQKKTDMTSFIIQHAFLIFIFSTYMYMNSGGSENANTTYQKNYCECVSNKCEG